MAIPSPKFSGLWAISISNRLLMPQIKEVLPGLISSRLSRRPLFAGPPGSFSSAVTPTILTQIAIT